MAMMIVIGACSWNREREITNSRAIKYDGILLSIPDGYEQGSVNDMITAWKDSGEEPEVIQRQISSLENLRDKEQAILFLLDKSDIANNIIVFRNPYFIKINRYTRQELFLMLEKALKKRAQETGNKSSLVESRYYSLTNGIDVLKIKFRFSNESGESYCTQYMVSSADATAGVIVNHATDDFENLVKRTNFDKDYGSAALDQDYTPSIKSAHPYAQEILRDFFFWNDSDPTSPFFGGDRYAIFNAFRKWRAAKKHLPVSSYVDTVITRQGYPRFNLWTVKPEDITKLWANDVRWDYINLTDNAIVTIAFSQFVLEGKIDENLRDLARNALKRESTKQMLIFFEKDYQPVRAEGLGKMLQAIERM